MYYQICCGPLSLFGTPGQTPPEKIKTETFLVIDDNGTCGVNPVRQQEPFEDLPADESQPCP